MLKEVDSASFKSNQLQHGTFQSVFMDERRFTNNKSSVGAPNSRENTAAEYPVVRVINKKKQQKRPEDGTYIMKKQ